MIFSPSDLSKQIHLVLKLTDNTKYWTVVPGVKLSLYEMAEIKEAKISRSAASGYRYGIVIYPCIMYNAEINNNKT